MCFENPQMIWNVSQNEMKKLNVSQADGIMSANKLKGINVYFWGTLDKLIQKPPLKLVWSVTF